MQSEFNNHFILISGESGAGKTEASKKILQFYAVSCPSTKLLNNVRDRLLLSNPVLEVSDMDICLPKLPPHKISFINTECISIYLPGFRKCQNLEEWQLEPLWEIHGHPVWPPGGLKYLHPLTLQWHINEHWSEVKDDLSPLGWCSWRSHPELPAGEVPRGPPEPRREKLPHLLPAGGGRRGGSAPLARPGEKMSALQIPGAGQRRWKANDSSLIWRNEKKPLDSDCFSFLSPSGWLCQS